MLWIGEMLGSLRNDPNAEEIDIAVDPLECTNHVAYDRPNAMAVLAAAPRGALLHAPDCYMDKLAGSKPLIGEVSLEGTVEYNLEAAGDALNKPIKDLEVVVMDRPRHTDLISRIQAKGANVSLIGDGDIAAALNSADPDQSTDLLMGIEHRLYFIRRNIFSSSPNTATALRGLDAFFEGQLVTTNLEHERRATEMVGDKLHHVWGRDELCSSKDSVYIGSGVCAGRVPGPTKNPDGSVVVYSEVIDVSTASRRVQSISFIG